MLRRSLLAGMTATALTGCGKGSGGGTDQDEDEYPDPDPQLAAQFRAWQRRTALPAIYLATAPSLPPAPSGSRIGGPVWLAPGETWPTDAAGRTMTFLAQIDFAGLPPLPDYPRAGILQFFIGRSDTYGADLSHPERGQFRVIWHAEPLSDAIRHDPPADHAANEGFTAPIDKATVTHGVALSGRLGRHAPTINSWQFERDFKAVFDRGRGHANALVDARFVEQPERHHIGGHPEFVQDDWRQPQHYRQADRVLLNLWSDRHIMWGDMGQGQFVIARADLLRRDFSKTYYQWDCS